jgi:hypothetical protein
LIPVSPDEEDFNPHAYEMSPKPHLDGYRSATPEKKDMGDIFKQLLDDCNHMKHRHTEFMESLNQPESLSDQEEEAKKVSVTPIYKANLDDGAKSWNPGYIERAKISFKKDKPENEDSIVVSTKGLLAELSKDIESEDNLSD